MKPEPPFESLLLVYLPTVLDPLAPEAKRANVPLDWASPAFDVLQLEDYDWVTSGNHGATDARDAVDDVAAWLSGRRAALFFGLCAAA